MGVVMQQNDEQAERVADACLLLAIQTGLVPTLALMRHNHADLWPESLDTRGDNNKVGIVAFGFTGLLVFVLNVTTLLKRESIALARAAGCEIRPQSDGLSTVTVFCAYVFASAFGVLAFADEEGSLSVVRVMGALSVLFLSFYLFGIRTSSFGLGNFGHLATMVLMYFIEMKYTADPSVDDTALYWHDLSLGWIGVLVIGIVIVWELTLLAVEPESDSFTTIDLAVHVFSDCFYRISEAVAFLITLPCGRRNKVD